jgi:benzodiazapine receptor
MNRAWRWPLINLVALIVTIGVNGLANALPLNGITTGDVINRDPVLFLPANWVFSIWGLI